MRSKWKKGSLIAIIGIVIIVAILFYRYPQNINKTIEMINLDGIYVNLDHNDNNSYNNEKYKVHLSLQKKRRIFNEAIVTGNVSINDQKYKVASTTKNGSIIVLYSDQNDRKRSLNLFSKDFDPIVIIHSDFVLAGPANTVEEAIQKYNQFYNIPAQTENN